MKPPDPKAQPSGPPAAGVPSRAPESRPPRWESCCWFSEAPLLPGPWSFFSPIAAVTHPSVPVSGSCLPPGQGPVSWLLCAAELGTECQAPDATPKGQMLGRRGGAPGPVRAPSRQRALVSLAGGAGGLGALLRGPSTAGISDVGSAGGCRSGHASALPPSVPGFEGAALAPGTAQAPTPAAAHAQSTARSHESATGDPAESHASTLLSAPGFTLGPRLRG